MVLGVFTRFCCHKGIVFIRLWQKRGGGGVEQGEGNREQGAGNDRWTGLAGLGRWIGGHDLIVRVRSLIDCKLWKDILIYFLQGRSVDPLSILFDKQPGGGCIGVVWPQGTLKLCERLGGGGVGRICLAFRGEGACLREVCVPNLA